MARVNLEEELFGDSRVDKLAALLNEPIRSAFGLLAMLWRETQKELKNEATKDEICDYCRAYSKDEQEKVFGSLLKSGWIKPINDDNLFKIIGNEKQTEMLQAYKERAKKLNKQRKNRILGKSENDSRNECRDDSRTDSCNDSRDECRTKVVTSVGSNAIQSNAKQFNTKQGNSKKEGEHWLAGLWNENCGKLPKCRTPLSKKRVKTITVRLKEEPNKDVWASAIRKVADSKFCNGSGGRSWVASFDFLISAGNLDKILEGQYDDREELSIVDSVKKRVLAKIKSKGFQGRSQDYEWKTDELEFVRGYGGIRNLGQLNEFKFDQIFKGAA